MPKSLTLEMLKADAPELVAQIEKAAFEQGRASAPDTTGLCQAAFRAVCSDADYQAGASLLDKALELKLDAAQLAGVAAALRGAMPQREESSARRLSSLLAAHPAPLNADAPAQARSALVADAESRNGGR